MVDIRLLTEGPLVRIHQEPDPGRSADQFLDLQQLLSLVIQGKEYSNYKLRCWNRQKMAVLSLPCNLVPTQPPILKQATQKLTRSLDLCAWLNDLTVIDLVC